MTPTTDKPGPLTSAECASVFRAMADESRLKILRALFGHERSVGDLSAELDFEQHFTSRHLAVLRHAGLVLARRDAQRMIYTLHPSVHDHMASSDDSIDLGCCEVRFRTPETS